MTWLALTASLVVGAEPFTLTWDAPPDCPDQSAAVKAIRGLLRRPPAPGAPHVDARVRLWLDGRWRMHLETSVDGVKGTRELEGSSCAELATATQLIVALAIDPDALEAAPVSPPRQRAPPPPPAPPPPAQEPPVVQDTAPPAEPPAAESPPPAPAPPPPSIAPAPPRAPPLQWSLFVSGALDLGTLPLAAPGVLGGASLRRGAWRTQLSLFSFPPRAAAGVRPGTSGDIALAGGGFRAGALLHDGWLEASFDAGVDAGVLSGRGVGFDRPSEGQGPWVAVLAGATAAKAFSDHWALRLTAEAGLTAHAAGFSADGALLHQPKLLFFRGLLGIEFRL